MYPSLSLLHIQTVLSEVKSDFTFTTPIPAALAEAVESNTLSSCKETGSTKEDDAVSATSNVAIPEATLS